MLDQWGKVMEGYHRVDKKKEEKNDKIQEEKKEKNNKVAFKKSICKIKKKLRERPLMFCLLHLQQVLVIIVG